VKWVFATGCDPAGAGPARHYGRTGQALWTFLVRLPKQQQNRLQSQQPGESQRLSNKRIDRCFCSVRRHSESKMPAPRPAYENRRLKALEQYRILDTAPERLYDDITRLACLLCRTPIAFISLVDRHRQWFKAKVGIDDAETPRDISFCAHTIMGHELLIIPDASQDPRFVESPLTQGPPHIRFYAGLPLVTPNGEAVGALCVVDRKPRTLAPEEADALHCLGRQVVQLLEFRRISAELAKAWEDLKTLESLLPICAHCRQVRDEAGCWSDLGEYVQRHTKTEFTHGICPSCAAAHFLEPAT
jgi:hypothetical protein